MEVHALPPITISHLEDSIATWQWVEGQTPVDFTTTVDGVGWSSDALIEREGCVIWRGPAALLPDGKVEITVPAIVGVQLRCACCRAVYQIRISAPFPEMTEVWRGPVVVAKVTE